LSRNLVQEQNQEAILPADWIERYFWVPRPRNPKTGEILPAGPIQLTDHQKHLINEALSRNPDGTFKYALVVYSAPKKSGKSAVAAAVATYVAHHSPYGFIACVANDGKQANDRIYAPIKQNYRLHRQQQGPFKDINPYEYEVTLPNFCKIEAVPVDAAGEAGGEPTLSVFCFDEDTEILTRDGWKRYDQYSMDDQFLTLRSDGYLEYQHPTHINVSQYGGPMYLLESSRYSLCVSPNHRLYGKFGSSSIALNKAQFEKRSVESAIEAGVYGMRVESLGLKRKPVDVPEFVTIPGTKRRPSLEIPVKLYLKFLGWYLSEGCTHKGDTVLLAQSSVSPYYEELKTLISDLGYVPRVWKGTDALVFYDTRIAKHLKQFGLAHEKYIPAWIKELPDEYLDVLLESYWRGDGYKTGDAVTQYGHIVYSTNSPKLRDDLLEIYARRGRYVTVTTYQDRRWGRPLYSVSVKPMGDGSRILHIKKDRWQKIDYEGIIHCPTVPNKTVVVRRHGKVHIQGNSELWGFDTPKKRQLWTELTVPPTLYGYAMQWVESYAGYTGVSILLESLYNTGKKEGTPHPDFSYLDTEEGPVVYTHAPSRMFMYWDTEPRMPWQLGTNYYEEQKNTLEPEEFERIHRNRWVSAKGAFIEAQWWDNCESPSLPVLKQGDKTPVVVAIDMSVSNDLAAMVAVTRDPINPDTCVAVRAVKIFNPKKLGGNIDQEQTVGNTIREWASRWNVICWVYDPYQMAKLVQDYRKDGFGWFDPFTQNTARGIADKQLYDMVMHRQLTWNRTTTIGDVGGPGREEDTLYQHIRQAGAVISGRQRRLEKLSPEAKIDAAVALSMAAYKCMELELDNREFEKEDLLQMLAKGEIELETFSQIVRQKFPELGEKYINGSR